MDIGAVGAVRQWRDISRGTDTQMYDVPWSVYRHISKPITEATVSFVMFVHLSVLIEVRPLLDQIFVKFHMWYSY
jgi:hypothetical protein